MKKKSFYRMALLLAALLLFGAACGGKGSDPGKESKSSAAEGESLGEGGVTQERATTMYLVKTEGTVGVADGQGTAVPLLAQTGLYSGYGVDTAGKSYAWINLDAVKLTKMDAESEVAIRKEGKALEIEVKKGSLFFHVAEPLGDDESMDIRTSTTIVGIRGTCGWVTVDEWEHLELYLMEGEVEYTFNDPDTGATESATVSAGETAKLARQDDGSFVLEKEDLWTAEFPAFVAWETENEIVQQHLEEYGLSPDMFTDETEAETEPEKKDVVLTMPVTSNEISAALRSRDTNSVTVQSGGQATTLELNFITVDEGKTLIFEEGINIELVNPDDYEEEMGKAPNLSVSGTVIVNGDVINEEGMLYVNGGRMEVSGNIVNGNNAEILIDNGPNGPANPEGQATLVVRGVIQNKGSIDNDGVIEGTIE